MSAYQYNINITFMTFLEINVFTKNILTLELKIRMSRWTGRT